MGNENLIDYNILIKESMYHLIKAILKRVAKNGINFDKGHYFYVSFNPDYQGVQMPSFLRNKYPEEITIVIQHKFKDLAVHDKYFEISLSFNTKYVKLVVPFKAINTFSDPSEMFELDLQQEFTHDDIYNNKYMSVINREVELEKEATDNMITSGKIIYLDKYRKLRGKTSFFEDEE